MAEVAVITMYPSLRSGLLAVAIFFAAATGCSRLPFEPAAQPEQKNLPPAYPQNQITDPALLDLANGFKTWALAQRAGKPEQPIYARVEILPPAQTVQPYGVGAYQQETRLPVILTTGPGWADLKRPQKEERTVAAFKEITSRLAPLKRNPPLQPTVTIQTPDGMVLAWINHLAPRGKNLHGD
jgi:hypothetical protein